MKIGVMVESFRSGLDGGLTAANDVGADGVQIYATDGPMHPDNLNGKARSALSRRLGDLGLELAALCGDFGGHGFQDESANPKRIDESKKVMDLALDLGCKVVTTHVGVIPADRGHRRYTVLARAGEALGSYGQQIGATFAIETGPEPAEVLRRFLDDVGTDDLGIGANFDPANLKMVLREDIVAAVATLGKYIVHTHAKDGRNIQPMDVELLYGARDARSGETVEWKDFFLEVPLGEGDVNFDTYLPALAGTGFDGFLTIEREVGDDPRTDIQQAIRFLRDKLAALTGRK